MAVSNSSDNKGLEPVEFVESKSVDVEKEMTTEHQGDYSGAVAKSDPEEIKLVKKLDYRIMPILWAMYFLNYLDRNAIAQARLNSLEKDLNLQGSEYNTCISILFVGYLLMQIPSNMLMSSGKVRPSTWMCIAMMTWAVVSACTALVRNYTGLVLVRFFLGVTEAPYYPGALYMLSLFYTRKEIATRISILYSGNLFATSFSGLIAAAVFNTIDGAHGLAGWRWLFIIEGVVTFGVALIGMYMLPDFPLTTRWLSEKERQLAHARIQRDTVGMTSSKGARAGFIQAIRDPRLYLFCLIQHLHLAATGFNNFFPTLIQGFGFNNTLSLVLQCPPYLVSGIVGIFIGWTSGKLNERTWHITACMGLAIIGFILSCASLNQAVRYVSCFLFATGAYAVNSVILGWVSATLGQTSEKKAVSLSIVNVVANVSFIYTPYLYPKSDGPRYTIAMSSNAAFALGTIICVWGLRVWLQLSNRKMRQANPESSVYYAY